VREPGYVFAAAGPDGDVTEQKVAVVFEIDRWQGCTPAYLRRVEGIILHGMVKEPGVGGDGVPAHAAAERIRLEFRLRPDMQVSSEISFEA
jgi:hypothetical protein